MEKKEVPPGSGHFESSGRSNVVQQDALNQLKLPARRTKFQKKDQCTWINDKCSETSSFFFFFYLKVRSNHNWCSWYMKKASETTDISHNVEL